MARKARAGAADIAYGINNRFLAKFPVSELRRLMPRATKVALVYNDRLFARGAAVPHLFFPGPGTVALIHRLPDGGTVEIAAVGDAGCVGIVAAVGIESHTVDAIVQSPGTALRFDAADLLQALRRSPRLSEIVMRYLACTCLETSQNIACYAHHTIEQRLARWLVAADDGVESGAVTVSHEFLSNMLGTQRTGITATLGGLKRAGLVDTGYNGVTVRDRKGLEAVACSCYRNVRRIYHNT